ncbi:disease resistance protein UNI-like isoform X2 [Cornus florida]|uniref:disease resistance protein UNI-like isoform X2 n=1 Tax=Cornus florida TaxID=4283 RepID=UPI0028A0C36D|nr:disease resistance protein UNI-like isoform X2 [Cornus florida]
MADLLILGAVTAVGSGLGFYIAKNVRNTFHFQKNFNSLRDEMEKLMEQRNVVKRMVERAESVQMQSTEQVKGWLRSVEEFNSEVEVLLEQVAAKEIQKKCLVICPRLKLSKKILKKLKVLTDLKSAGNFSTVAEALPPGRVEEVPLEMTVGLDSAFDKVWDLLGRNDEVGIIGIFGIEGVGKTTLLKKLNNELANQLIAEFDVVIWVAVSKDLNVEKVQYQIGRRLGFPHDIWRDKSQDQKKADIFRVLKMKRFVLLLDDIWERLDHLEVGIPLPNEQNKSKIVFTTPYKHVCGLMEAQRNIELECLSPQQAWDLFQDKVRKEILNSDPEIFNLAQHICQECAGLPRKLVTVARAMASKTTSKEWNDAITFFRISSSQLSEGQFRDDTAVFSKSYSDDSNIGNDDDSYSTTMETKCLPAPCPKFRRIIKSWQKGDLLGSGSFGTVYEAFTDYGFFFAVKEVSLLDQGSKVQLQQEISLLRHFEHENIVQYLGTEKNDGKLYIFLELVSNGSLANLYRKYQLRDSQVSVYTRDILNGLNYLHSRNVVHRDIKCANILVDINGSVKLADFGLAKKTKFNDIKSCKGTVFWMAPEVVKSRGGYGLAADIWSLGCTVLEMLTRQVPYSHLEAPQALYRIGRGETPPIPGYLSRDAQDFILECLKVNPDDRPIAAKLLDHPFVKRQSTTSVDPVSPL